MDSVPLEKPVVPNPTIPRVIGSMNLIFGTFLFLMGWGCLGRVGPSFAENRPFRLEAGDVQNLYDQVHKELLSGIDAREAASENPEEKSRLRKQRLALAADNRADVERTLDLGAVNRDLLWTSWYFWADFVTGPVLNLLMLASGIGLIQLKEWARKMALWVAGLKIVRLVVLTTLLMAVVIPHTGAALERVISTKLGEVLIAKLNFDQAAQAGGKSVTGALTPQDFVPQMNLLEYGIAILILVFGLVYPAIMLALLTRPSAREACVFSEEPEAD